jgi:hypothetical protein
MGCNARKTTTKQKTYQLQTTSHINCSALFFLKKESPFSFASSAVQHLSFKAGVVKFTLEENVHFK